MADKGGRLELLGLDELGEHLAVHADGHVLVLVAFGLAEAEQVEDVYREPFGDRWGDVAPQH